MKQLYVITGPGGVRKDSEGRILFFDTPEAASQVISKKFGNSPYLRIDRWKHA